MSEYSAEQQINISIRHICELRGTKEDTFITKHPRKVRIYCEINKYIDFRLQRNLCRASLVQIRKSKFETSARQ